MKVYILMEREHDEDEYYAVLAVFSTMQMAVGLQEALTKNGSRSEFDIQEHRVDHLNVGSWKLVHPDTDPSVLTDSK